tara:strand:+ start:315 stop:545 length:231 start_codon:yes stop_codon:yes gene_type:complete
MIREVRMYGINCDNCGVDLGENQEVTCWCEPKYATLVAIDSNWVRVGENKHYCPDCYSYDDNDKLVLNKNRERNER